MSSGTDSISSTDAKFYCYGMLALEESNCEKIEYITMKSDCYDGLAKIKKDISVCSSDLCRENIAITLENSSYCSEITIPSSKDRCFEKIALLKQDESICENIQNVKTGSGIYSKDSCYKNVAKEKSDISINDV